MSIAPVPILLNRREVDCLYDALELIDYLFFQFKDYVRRPFVFVEHLHDILPEVKRIESGRIDLEVADILRANHKSLADIFAIEEELESLRQVDRFSIQH